MTLLAIIAKFSPVLSRLLSDLSQIQATQPESAELIEQIKTKLNTAFNPVSLLVSASNAVAELTALVQTGEGEVTHDPVDLS